MFYRLKEVFDIYEVDGLRPRTRNSGPSIKKLTMENKRLKKMLAEKEPEVSMLQESYKKRGDSDPDGSVQVQGSPGDKNARYSQHSWKILL